MGEEAREFRPKSEPLACREQLQPMGVCEHTHTHTHGCRAGQKACTDFTSFSEEIAMV